MTDLSREAGDLAALGYRVHPLKPGAKTPKLSGWQRLATSDQEQVEQWWTEDPRANLGIRVSDDETFVDIDTPESYTAFRERCPVDTTTSRTPRGGWHLRFRGRAKSRVLVRDGRNRLLEVKGTGTNIVGVGSVVNGKAYRWEKPPWELPPTDIPAELVAWIDETRADRRPSKRLTPERRSIIPETRRNMTLTQLAGNLWRAGLARETLEGALLDHNRRWCRPPLDEDEVRRIAASASRFPDPPPWASGPDRWSLDVCIALELPPAARLVLYALAASADDNGHITRGIRRLVRETGFADKTVSKAIEALEDAGVMRKLNVDSPYGTTYEIARIELDLGEKQPGGGSSVVHLRHPKAPVRS
jgi:DNA-binding transcriptional ArsR family regulator